MNQKQRTIGFFSLVGLLTILGTCLIVSSCKDSNPPQQQVAQQQYQQQPQQPGQTIIYEQAPQQDHFWENMYLWHVLTSSSRPTVIYHPVPVYHPVYQPAPVVNKTVQNITINQTVNNHAASPTPAPVAKPAVVPGDDQKYTQKAVATQAPVQKGSFWSSPTQVVKASTIYPKASNSDSGGGYAVKSTGYSGYSQKSSYGSSGFSSRRR